MSVTSTTAVVETAGNGVKLAFDFNFKILAATDLVIKKKAADGSYSSALILNSDYTVVFDSAAETGSVTFTTAPVSGGAANIARSSSSQQPTVLPREGQMPAKTLELMVDRLTLLYQELVAQVNATIVTPQIGYRTGAFSALDTAAGTSTFIAKITDTRSIGVFLGDRTQGDNGWVVLGGY